MCSHDLPPVSEIVYHCQLSDVQLELYKSYAASARDELVKLVERDGFDKVQIHVLATLTRLKQICCHPAIFAKEKAEMGIRPNTICFSSFSKPLSKATIRRSFSANTPVCSRSCGKILSREAFRSLISMARRKIGSRLSKSLMKIQKSCFPRLAESGRHGLNLVGADTVIHYDMWWNPAVETKLPTGFIASDRKILSPLTS